MSHLCKMRQEVENMCHERSFQPDWALYVYTNPLRVQPVHETQISPKELSQCPKPEMKTFRPLHGVRYLC